MINIHYIYEIIRESIKRLHFQFQYISVTGLDFECLLPRCHTILSESRNQEIDHKEQVLGVILSLATF